MPKQIRVAEDIVPIGEFKAQAARLLDRLRVTGFPLVVTQNGKPAAVMLSPVEYDRLQNRAAFVQSVAAGLTDADAGRVMDTKTIRERLKERRLKP
ncbi:MAG: type II toxin-antitoxin system Phd/YefM family antitoxin [Nitrospira sp.]|nr:type II toxin-antitoxin system Phd/YefM family antitoxin [Nitrospira sp.]